MKIIDLQDKHKAAFLCCLEDWSDEMKESGIHRECWYNQMKDKGLGVKLAENEYGCVGGMIQYIPIEHSPAAGKDLYFIPCIWVHGYKKGRGNFQKKGMGKALLQAAEEDVRQRGAKGLVAWGLALPFWMKASWYKKQGYKTVENLKGQVLLWKPFTDDAEPPSWIRPCRKPDLVQGRVVVTALVNGACSVGGINFERARRAAETFGDKVIFKGIDTSDRTTFLKWGRTDAVFIDRKNMVTGPPPSYKRIHRKIAGKAKKLK